jgi:hypothetical protein
LVSHQAYQLLTADHVPHFRRLIQTPSRQTLPVQAPGDTYYTIVVAYKCNHFLPARSVPDLRGLIGTSRRQTLSIRTPRHAVDIIRMTLQSNQSFPLTAFQSVAV